MWSQGDSFNVVQQREELMVVPDLTTKGTKKHEGSRPLCNFVSFVVYEIRTLSN